MSKERGGTDQGTGWRKDPGQVSSGLKNKNWGGGGLLVETKIWRKEKPRKRQEWFLCYNQDVDYVARFRGRETVESNWAICQQHDDLPVLQGQQESWSLELVNGWRFKVWTRKHKNQSATMEACLSKCSLCYYFIYFSLFLLLNKDSEWLTFSSPFVIFYIKKQHTQSESVPIYLPVYSNDNPVRLSWEYIWMI